jgi:hypothetical protein
MFGAGCLVEYTLSSMAQQQKLPAMETLISPEFFMGIEVDSNLLHLPEYNESMMSE